MKKEDRERYHQMPDGELCVRFREKRDEDALEILIRRHDGFCYEEALKRAGNSASIEDLVAEGERGIYEASLRFDPDSGVKFLSFAGKYVTGNMYKRIEECASWERKTTELEDADNEIDWAGYADSRTAMFRVCAPAEERAVRKAYTQEIKSCIDHLSEREREILLEKFFDPPALWALIHPGKEISDEKLAEHFGIPLRLLKRNLKDAYEKLRVELDPEIPERIHKNEERSFWREKGAFINAEFWIVCP